MSRPDTLPSRCDDDAAAKIVEPSSTKNLQGFIYEERPAFQFWNWVQRNFVKCILHIDVSVYLFDRHEATTPDMTVVITAGKVQNRVTVASVSTQTTAAISAPATNPRTDLVTVSLIDGTYNIVTGDESASPVTPDVPFGYKPISLIDLVVSQTSILNSDITDIRSAANNDELIDEITVSGGAVTQIDFTGLDINKHKGYRIEIEAQNAVASTVLLEMFVNGDTTSINYYSQTLVSTGASVTSSRANDADTLILAPTEDNKGCINLSLLNDYPCANIVANNRPAATMVQYLASWKKTATVSNITQLTFIADTAAALDNGTRIRIYREDV